MTYTNSGDTTGRCPICGFGFDSKGYLVWRQADGAGNDGEWHRYGDLVACRHNESVIAASLSRHCGLSPTEQMEMLWAEVRAEVEGREEAVKRVVAAWKVGKGLVALEGPPGTGKTRLMMTVVNESRKAGRSAIYITMARLMEHMRQVYDDLRGKQYSALVEKVGQAAVVCIDEIDKARVTEFVKERWFTFLDDPLPHGGECLDSCGVQ